MSTSTDNIRALLPFTVSPSNNVNSAVADWDLKPCRILIQAGVLLSYYTGGSTFKVDTLDRQDVYLPCSHDSYFYITSRGMMFDRGIEINASDGFKRNDPSPDAIELALPDDQTPTFFTRYMMRPVGLTKVQFCSPVESCKVDVMDTVGSDRAIDSQAASWLLFDRHVPNDHPLSGWERDQGGAAPAKIVHWSREDQLACQSDPTRKPSFTTVC